MLNDYDAVVVACFGTGNSIAFKNTFYNLYQELVKRIDKPGFLALTSSVFLNKFNLKGLDEIFGQLKEEGYERILVIPLILANGKEYQSVLKSVSKTSFKKIEVLKPILESHNAEIAKMLSDSLHRCDEVYLLLGHGSKGHDNHEYMKLQDELFMLGRDDIKVILMDDENDYEGILCPLFIASGHHYQEYLETHANRHLDKSLGEYSQLAEIIYKGICI